jgi:hypothetical protein
VTGPNPYAYHGEPPAAVPAALPARRRLSLVWALVGVVAAVGIGLGAGALAVPSDKSQPQAVSPEGTPSVRLLRIGAAPKSVGADQRIEDGRGRRGEWRIRRAMTNANSVAADLVDDALIAVHAVPGSPGPDLLVVANDADNPTVSQLLHSGQPDASNINFLLGLGATNAIAFAPDPLGGSLRCGPQPSLSATVCAWFDDSTFGYVVDYSAVPPKRVAHLTRRIRVATEH